jgi:dTDP-4-amino-4,6-dideoxygalactose transaminase
LPQIDQFTFYRGRVAQAALLRALDVGPGDDVAVQAFTCVAVPEAVLSTGARPLYIDVAPSRFTMDPDDLAAKLTPRTRAIVVQHTFGIPADWDGILAVAKARGLPLIEDCAHAIGTTLNDRLVGSLGSASFYSFEASKPVFVGIGGSAQVNDPALVAGMHAQYALHTAPSLSLQAQILAMYLAHRVAYRPSNYWLIRSLFRSVAATGLIPGNYNVISANTPPADDFRRTLGRCQRWLLRGALRRLRGDIPRRRWVAAEYRSRIAGPGIRHPDVPAGSDPVYGRYPLLVESKKDILRRAPEMRVEVTDWYATPVHPLSNEALNAVGYRAGSCPNAESLTKRVISLPTGHLVNESLIERTARLFAQT